MFVSVPLWWWAFSPPAPANPPRGVLGFEQVLGFCCCRDRGESSPGCCYFAGCLGWWLGLLHLKWGWVDRLGFCALLGWVVSLLVLGMLRWVVRLLVLGMLRWVLLGESVAKQCIHFLAVGFVTVQRQNPPQCRGSLTKPTATTKPTAACEPGGWSLEGGVWMVEPGGWSLEGGVWDPELGLGRVGAGCIMTFAKRNVIMYIIGLVP